MNDHTRDAEKFQDGAPAVFHRRNRHGWLVTMRLPDWMEMYQKVAVPGNRGAGADVDGSKQKIFN